MFAPVYQFLNPLDLALVAFLVAGFPLLQIVPRMLRRRRPETSLIRRYVRSGLILGLPLILLAIDWIGSGRSALELGLGLPPSTRGLIGLGIAAVAVGVMVVMTLLQPVPDDPEKRMALARRMKGAGLLPDCPRELGFAFGYALIVGCGAELLFRAFLLWAFVPLVGQAGAIVVAALAYGIGHGYRNRREALGALAAAFAFTVAYGLTWSVWWLMAIHTLAGLQGSWMGYRLARPRGG